MAKAREDEKPIVYIGFGSITVPHPKRVTARIVNAVVQSERLFQFFLSACLMLVGT
jgi:sterol 3beta-glucosyltransferase